MNFVYASLQPLFMVRQHKQKSRVNEESNIYSLTNTVVQGPTHQGW